MFSTASRSDRDPKLEALLAEVSRDVFGSDEQKQQLDFAEIERRSHEVGRRVARRLTEEALAEQARARQGPRECPECGTPVAGVVVPRDLETRDGVISLDEIRCDCPRCRRAFFPRASSPAGHESAL